MPKRALRFLFWGLLLQFFSIQIANLQVVTKSMGVLLLIAGFWILADENPHFRRGLRWSAVILIFEAVTFSLPYVWGRSVDQPSAIIILIIGNVLNLCLLYQLFAGLHKLADKLEPIYLDKNLVRKSGHFFPCYLVAAATALISVFIPPLFWVGLPVLLLLFLYILVNIYRFGSGIPDGAAVTVRPLGRGFWLCLGAYAVITALGLGTVMAITSRPHVEAALYEKAAVPSTQLQSARSHMESLGYPPELLEDLPEEAILRHLDVLSMEANTLYWSVDGGSLELHLYNGYFKDGKIRLLVHYHWTTPPKHGYTDLVAFSLGQTFMASPDFDKLHLYDDSETGETFSHESLEDSSASGSYYKPYIQFRVFDNQGNQRGYMELDMRISDYTRAQAFNIGIIYSHQRSMFNIPYYNPAEQAVSQPWVNQDTHAFQSQYWLTEWDYIPPESVRAK